VFVAAAAFGAQQGVLIVWIIANSALSHEPAAQFLGADGVSVTLATCASMPVTIGFIWMFTTLRKGISVKEYLALNPLSWRGAARWCAALAGLVGLSDVLTTLLHRPLVPEVMVQMYQNA